MTTPATAPVPPLPPAPSLPWRTWLVMFARLLAVQGSWNYELMLGTGIGYATEPALRSLPGGLGGAAYHEALARQSRYFNAHPYLAAVAVGALARAELAGQPPAQIERFRSAMCGPLGSVGDRLVWAGWLPCCSMLALLAYGLGAGAAAVVTLFLVVYNVGHIGLRAWGLRVGWRNGLRVASALANPVLRRGPQYIARAVLVLAGAAIPLAIRRALAGVVLAPAPGPIVGTVSTAAAASILGAAALGVALGWLHGRVEGWRAALVVLAALIIFSVIR
ncbi:MAG TPA: PTS system mannose/fructose/sorbose family transporter subunit IID [Gemmatimonadaceae bacterium]